MPDSLDCMWVIGEPISVFKEAVEKETGILTEVDTYDWITFLPMSDGGGAYNRYFGRLNTGKMKIRGVMARKGDTPEYVKRMQQEVFEVLAETGIFGSKIAEFDRDRGQPVGQRLAGRIECFQLPRITDQLRHAPQEALLAADSPHQLL